MMRPPFDRPEVLRKLRPAFQTGPIRSLILPGACEPRPPHARFKKLSIANRGNYEVADLHDLALAGELRAFAEAVTGLPLRPSAELRLFRFRRGGYSLFYDDALARLTAGLEVTLDLSRQTSFAPIVYQAGPQQKLVVPQAPGLVALVERTPSTFRYDRYLSAQTGRAQVLRLRAAFRYAD
jgi:hypothetical protein